MGYFIHSPNEDQLAAAILAVERYARERHSDDGASEGEEVSPSELLVLAIAARKLLAMRPLLVDISEGEDWKGNAETGLDLLPEPAADAVIGVAHTEAWPLHAKETDNED